MKSQDVQIGDWVRFFGRNGNPSAEPHWYNRKVTSDWIANMEKHEAMLDNLRSNGVVIDGPQIGDTEPIPLTEEVLKANGFNFESRPEHSRFISIDTDDVYIGAMHYDDSFGRFFTEIDANGTFIKKELHCVHELQMILRCCGMFDLANNFKV